MNKNLFLILTLILLLCSCKLFNSNSSPVAVFTVVPTTGTIETVFTFDASGCSDEEDATDELMVRWDWENDGIYDTEWSVIKIATHQNYTRGVHTVKLQVKDNDSSTDVFKETIEIFNSAPTALFSITPNEGSTSTIFMLDANGCTDNENETSELMVRWDWENDGNWDTNYDTLKVITHQFNSPSNYTVALKVIDTEAFEDSITKSLEVSAECGASITEDIILNADLECSTNDYDALSINTSNITLDLGGHTIKNTSNNPNKSGIVVWDVENLTIKNGSIEGFLYGIHIGNSSNIRIENVKIKNLKITNPNIHVFGINIDNCRDFNITNCRFEYPQVYHKNAIALSRSFINVDNIVVVSGGVGVDFGEGDACGGESINNGGTVTNSKFIDLNTAGVLIQCSNNTLIQGNEFIRNEFGILAYGHDFGNIKSVTIEDNYIHDGFQGIAFYGVTESIINNNIIQNSGWHGIWMNQCHTCELGIQPNPFYSTGNTISNNIVTGNSIDLAHHEQAVGNTWINNTCQTKEGDEIPECTD